MTDTPALPFSWRFGFRPLPNEQERRAFTERLRLELWAAMLRSFVSPLIERRRFLVDSGLDVNPIRTVIMNLMSTGCHFHLELGIDYERLWASMLSNWWKSAEWYDIADVVELICAISATTRSDVQTAVNPVLAQNLSIWRVADGRFVPVASAEELRAIDDALSSLPWSMAADHLRKAITCLGDRRSPDPANAIKESISAVESAVRLIVKDENAILGTVLPRLQAAFPKVHPALVKSWTALYGYAGDASGVRHGAKSDAAPRTESEARLAVVTCSAILNFLKDAIRGNP